MQLKWYIGASVALVMLLQFGCVQTSEPPLPGAKPSNRIETPPTTTAAEFVDPPESYTVEMLELQNEFEYSTGVAVTKLAKIAAKADRITFYEGLPHQNDERPSVIREIKTKAVINLHGYPFYAEPLEVSDEDSRILVEMLHQGVAFKRFSSAKSCGGYHPDYAVEYRAGAEVVRVLFCLGCCEAKIYAVGIRSRHDLILHAALLSILGKYQKNRPDESLSFEPRG